MGLDDAPKPLCVNGSTRTELHGIPRELPRRFPDQDLAGHCRLLESGRHVDDGSGHEGLSGRAGPGCHRTGIHSDMDLQRVRQAE
jgi:hypothetical protein